MGNCFKMNDPNPNPNATSVANVNDTSLANSDAKIPGINKEDKRKNVCLLLAIITNVILIICCIILGIVLAKEKNKNSKNAKISSDDTKKEINKSLQESAKSTQEQRVKKFITNKSRFCGVEKIKIKPKLLNLTKLNKMEQSSSSYYSPFSTGIDFTSFAKPSRMSSSVYTKIKDLILETANEFRKFLQIQHEDIPLTDSEKDYIKYACAVSKVGDNFNSYFKYYDLIIFPSFENLGESTIAAAGPCVFIGENNIRPVGGVLYINTNLDFTKTNTELYMKSILIHEITHVLVFHPYVMEKLGIVKQQGNNYYIASSLVLNAIKKHFGCNSISKFLLENQGGEGTVGAHWESRYMLGDYMVSTDYPGAVMSDITLALFDATGYYKTKPYSGGLFKFGKNKGCDFLDKKCIESGKPISEDEFCITPYEPKCSNARNMKLSCYLEDYSKYDVDIPIDYQYFDNKYLGGFWPANFCPVALELNAENDYFNYSCNVGKSILNSDYGETIGYDSLCFISSLLPSTSSQKETTQAVCYKVKCNSSNKNYEVQIGSKKITCPTNGGIMTSSDFKGKINCAKYDDVCQTNNNIICSEMFDCFTKLAKNDGYNYGTNPVLNDDGDAVVSEYIKQESGAKVISAVFNLFLLMLIMIIQN